MIEWDYLRVVLAIHRAGSMQAAAESLGIDRTTVLRRLDALEKKLGSRLFDRSSEGCTATDKGEEVVGTALSVEQALSGLSQRVANDQAAVAGRVVVTVPEYFAATMLAPALPQLAQKHPEIELRILCGYQHYNLVRGEADIGLRNRWPEQTSLIARKVASVGHAFYAAKSYIAARGPPRGDFSGHDMILFDETLVTMASYDEMMRLASVGRIVLRGNEIMPLLSAAKAGLGVAYLPCLATHGSPELVPVWPGRIGPTRDVFLVAHAGLHEQPRIRIVYDFMAALCTQLAPAIAGQAVVDAFPPA